MKKLITLAAAVASLGAAKAATITVSPGFNAAADIEVTLNGAVTPSGFTVAIGSWDGATFTQFGPTITGDTGSVNGVFAATAPAEVNSDVIFVYVGIGNSVSTSGGQFALFRTATNTAFPSDVSSVSATQTVNFHNGTPGNVVFVTGSNAQFTGNVVNFVPEPSAALLGALGVVGLLRRRRR
jgi:hypothetical protein